MITFITLGVGWFVGNVFAGAVVKHFPKGSGTDWTSVWLVPMAGSLLATVIFYILFRESPGLRETSDRPGDGIEQP